MVLCFFLFNFICYTVVFKFIARRNGISFWWCSNGGFGDDEAFNRISVHFIIDKKFNFPAKSFKNRGIYKIVAYTFRTTFVDLQAS